jgi:hypothetical protein
MYNVFDLDRFWLLLRAPVRSTMFGSLGASCRG